jgi:hypothetical protein
MKVLQDNSAPRNHATARILRIAVVDLNDPEGNYNNQPSFSSMFVDSSRIELDRLPVRPGTCQLL